ncbi:MAG TPA: hypothetical protein VN665_02685 [Candidatus Paceibacterota bacterium]|nr:hypothetical protein [Candidatus Paceibacterota bacterium]
MPHVIVHFDPKFVEQREVDKLKKALPEVVALALSSTESLPRDLPQDSAKREIRTQTHEIFVRQQEAHPTDVNPAYIEIVVEAGKSKLRDPEKVCGLIIKDIVGLLPERLIGPAFSCVWVKFCPENGFQFTST